MPRIRLCGLVLKNRVGTAGDELVGRRKFRVLVGAALEDARIAARRSVRVCNLHDSQAMVVSRLILSARGLLQGGLRGCAL